MEVKKGIEDNVTQNPFNPLSHFRRRLAVVEEVDLLRGPSSHRPGHCQRIHANDVGRRTQKARVRQIRIPQDQVKGETKGGEVMSLVHVKGEFVDSRSLNSSHFSLISSLFSPLSSSFPYQPNLPAFSLGRRKPQPVPQSPHQRPARRIRRTLNVTLSVEKGIEVENRKSESEVTPKTAFPSIQVNTPQNHLILLQSLFPLIALRPCVCNDLQSNP